MSVRRQSHKDRHGAVTVADVARRAGVSVASVSRALNNPQIVRAPLRERIDTAIEELGYIPSGAARALVTRQVRAIGAIVPTLDNAIFASCISALQHRLAGAGYTLLVAAAEYDLDQELSEARAMLSHGIGGLMLVGQSHHPTLYGLLDQKGVAHVSCWTYSATAPYPCIGFDNYAAARRLAETVINLGHRRIAMIAGITVNNDRAAGRLAGVRRALAQHDLALPQEWVVEMPYALSGGKQGLQMVQAARSDRPTAVICGNDVLAIGALLECQAQGIDVPRELSIVGFDDLPLAAYLHPPLTTVRVPASEMGSRAAEFLLARLRGQRVVDHVEVETSVILRDTCAPPS